MAKQITEEQVERIVESIVDNIEEANSRYLEEIGKSISKIKELTPTQAQQLIQMLKYGGNYEDIVKQISKYTDLSIKEIDEIFEAYSKKDQTFYKQFYEYRNVPYIEYKNNVALQNQTKALARVVKNDLYQFTRENVLGYAIEDLDGVKRFMGLRETYNRVLDEALLNVSQGKEGFDSAMSNILEQLGGSGLRTLEYKSGRHMRLDSAVRMNLQSRLRELHNENQQMFGQEFGADGVEISVHFNPAPDHADIQGRQFRNTKEKGEAFTDWERIQKGEEVKDYKGVPRQLEHSKSGSYRPISELNCYHYIFPIILGVSEPEYSDEKLKNIRDDNEKGFEYEGKHYTNYEGTQLQRNLENQIRRQKDIHTLAKASDNPDLVVKAQKNIDKYLQKYKELSDASGLPTRADRLSVKGFKRIKLK